jgi:indolepyruvate ferredoxin oxidoreductase
VYALNTNKLAEKVMGDSVFANVMMLGFAYQKGLVPVSEVALKQAILLNGVAVEKNAKAFDIGRVLAHDPDAVSREKTREAETVGTVTTKRVAFLTEYQNAAYAGRFEQRIAALAKVLPDDLLIEAAKSLFKLMAYKDEYEVARLQLDRQFTVQLNEEFEGDFKVNYHMSPPILPLGRDAQGRPKKFMLGPWMRPVLGALAKARGLRGSMLDVFRFSADRKLDLELLSWFEDVLDVVEKGYNTSNRDACWALLTAPKEIRGYGAVREVSAENTRKSVTMLETTLSAKV